MHSAPSVRYPLGAALLAARLSAALLGLNLLVLALWWQQSTSDQALWPQALAWVTLLLTAGLAQRSLHRQARGELHWEQQQWHWCDASGQHRSGTLTLELDAQRVLLLRFVATAPAPRATCWFWLEQRSRPSAWHDLRRAVLAHAVGTAAQATPA